MLEWQRTRPTPEKANKVSKSGRGMVEMERSDWSDLRQESSKGNEAPDIPDSDSTDVALRLQNMANVS